MTCREFVKLFEVEKSSDNPKSQELVVYHIRRGLISVMLLKFALGYKGYALNLKQFIVNFVDDPSRPNVTIVDNNGHQVDDQTLYEHREIFFTFILSWIFE
jgi:hypothetical protein